MHCDVIRDLLPLYTDGLTSQKTNQLIEEHLSSCPECRAYLESLRMPVEVLPADDGGDKLIKALRRQKRRSQAITISICVLVPLVILLTWWVYMETHFKTSVLRLDSTEPAVILEEEPQAKVTDDEIQLSKILFSHPVILEAYAKEEETANTPEFTQISSPLLEETLLEFLPEGSYISGILVSCNHGYIVLDYHCNQTRVILEITDGDGTGHIDAITKTVATPEKDGNIKSVYTSTYYTATKESTFEKHSSYRKWFGFLESP